MTKPLKYLFTLGLPVAAMGLGALWMLGPKDGSRAGLVYDTVAVAKGPIRKIVSTSGPVRALVTVSIGSQVSGQVETLKVDFNSEVKAGDVLATIDDRSFAARVAQAKGDLVSAKAGVANQEAALTRAKAIKTAAELNMKRQETLQQKGFAATVTLDNARRDSDVAVADIAVATAQIASAKAVIVQREASLQQAEVDLERTKILSPIEGTVISRSVDIGQTVAASFQAPELFKIAQDLRRIRIEAQVNEADVGAVAEGNAATFTVDSYPDRTFEGKVTQVRLSATELNNVVTYTVIIEAANEDRKLFPGMTANVQIEVSKKDDALRVPSDALRFRPRGETAGDQSQRRGGDRGERQLARLKTELQLTEPQETAIRTELGKLFAVRTSAPGGMDTTAVDPGAMRQKMQAAIEQTLTPLLSDEQRPMFDKWKRGRENTKSGNVHVQDAAGNLERRFVRLGISDEQFTEIAGGQLAEGERVVVKAREAAK